MTDADKAELRALAEAATQPRSAFDGQFWDFHNAVTPAAVLELLDEVERLREVATRLVQAQHAVERLFGQEPGQDEEAAVIKEFEDAHHAMDDVLGIPRRPKT